MNIIILLLKSSISRVFSRRFLLASKDFYFTAFLNKTLRFVVYDGLKQSNKAKISINQVKFNGGGV